MRLRLLVIVAAVGVVAGFAVWRLLHPHSILYAALPASAPASCSAPSGLGVPPDGKPWLDPHPSGGVALWHPGMNAHPCTQTLTHLDATQAAAVASAVDHFHVPSGTFNCPADDGSTVTVYLTYPGRSQAEVVVNRLAGCGGYGILDDLGPMPAHLH